MLPIENILYGIIGFAAIYLILDIVEKIRGKRL